MRPAIGEQAVKDSWFRGSDVLWTLGIPEEVAPKGQSARVGKGTLKRQIAQDCLFQRLLRLSSGSICLLDEWCACFSSPLPMCRKYAQNEPHAGAVRTSKETQQRP